MFVESLGDAPGGGVVTFAESGGQDEDAHEEKDEA